MTTVKELEQRIEVLEKKLHEAIKTIHLLVHQPASEYLDEVLERIDDSRKIGVTSRGRTSTRSAHYVSRPPSTRKQREAGLPKGKEKDR